MPSMDATAATIVAKSNARVIMPGVAKIESVSEVTAAAVARVAFCAA